MNVSSNIEYIEKLDFSFHVHESVSKCGWPTSIYKLDLHIHESVSECGQRTVVHI